MADPRRTRVSPWLVLAVVVASIALLAAGAVLAWAQHDRDQARQEQARVELALATTRDARAADRLASTREAITGIRAHLDGITTGSARVSDLTQQDAQLVEATLDAALKGDVTSYNDAVGKRNAVAPQVDAATEQLRTDVNAALDALAGVTGRTAP